MKRLKLREFTEEFIGITEKSQGRSPLENKRQYYCECA